MREMGAEARVLTDGTLNAALERTEHEVVEKVLARAKGNVAEAAAILGIVRPGLYRIMKRYGIASPTQSKVESPA
jgi:transcriptional regulator of acetoin/glycerol metabolism